MPGAKSKTPFSEGARVRLLQRHDAGGPEVGALGTVAVAEHSRCGPVRPGGRSLVGVSWDSFHGGHNLSGGTTKLLQGKKSESGWWVPPEKLELVEPESTPRPCVHAEMGAGEVLAGPFIEYGGRELVVFRAGDGYIWLVPQAEVHDA